MSGSQLEVEYEGMVDRHELYAKYGIAAEAAQLFETELSTLLLCLRAVENGWHIIPDSERASAVLREACPQWVNSGHYRLDCFGGHNCLLEILASAPVQCAMAAQKQHYVPQFILRQFLSDPDKEQVSVYDKHDDKTFVTSIKNIMAERRFNDFAFNDEYMASFEPVAGRAEDAVLPAYKQVIKDRRLDGSPEQTGALAMLMAFQFVRSKANRQMWADMEAMIVEVVESNGGRMQDVEGWSDWKPATEDSLKRDHLTSIQHSLLEFAQIIATKDFLLTEPPPGRRFYLGDNPVGLSNDNDFGPYGNIGLAVPGIQIYMPLASDLMLCAWCPSILGEIRERLEANKSESRGEALKRVMSGQLTPAQMKAAMQQIEAQEAPHEALLAAVAEGRPIASSGDNMDYYNSIQTRSAVRYIVCQQADFALARRFNREHPKFRRGHRMRNATRPATPDHEPAT